MKILTSSTFYKEIYTNSIFKPGILKYTLIAMRDYLFYKDKLKKYIESQEQKEILFYSYWHTEASYALQSLKAYFPQIKVVSRIHGYDLYRERKMYNYMPLKNQFIDNIDKLYAISGKGKEYLINTYGYDESIIKVSRLGVNDLKIITLPTEKNTMHIVSCSYLVKVKRIDKIIDALYELSVKNRNLNIIWSHIGDGSMKNELEEYASEKIGIQKNITYNFKGRFSNQEVYEFYRNNCIDLFLNVSESEGVPVTIMEAMCCHIPIVAPDIGGISEMIINRKNGYLLSNKCDIGEIVNAISDIVFFKNDKTRSKVFDVFTEKYNAKNNYQSFIDSLISLKDIR